MKYSQIFENRIACSNEEDVFKYFMNTLKETIKGWDFFVDWEKVFSKIGNVEVCLYIMNSLIGKENVSHELKKLLSTYPEIAATLPILLAIREKSAKILEPSPQNIFNFREFFFSHKERLSEECIDSLVEFAEKSGITQMLQNKRISNLVDYVMGVEVGLDSNARKNRSGSAMESITEFIISEICVKNNYRYIPQATSSKIRAQMGIEIVVDKSERSFDYAIDTSKKLYLIETNYYGGGGSKLKAVAGEFTSLSSFIKTVTPQHGFIWITDGKGWETTIKPLKESFERIDYILNLDMIGSGVLEDILEKGE